MDIYIYSILDCLTVVYYVSVLAYFCFKNPLFACRNTLFMVPSACCGSEPDSRFVKTSDLTSPSLYRQTWLLITLTLSSLLLIRLVCQLMRASRRRFLLRHSCAHVSLSSASRETLLVSSPQLHWYHERISAFYVKYKTQYSIYSRISGRNTQQMKSEHITNIKDTITTADRHFMCWCIKRRAEQQKCSDWKNLEESWRR